MRPSSRTPIWASGRSAASKGRTHDCRRLPPCARVGAGARGELVVEGGNPLIQLEPFRAHLVGQPAYPWAERGVVVRVRHRRKVLLQLAASLRDGAAALEQNGAQLVN